MAGNGRGGGHGRTDQVSAAAGALPALEVAVAGAGGAGRASLSGFIARHMLQPPRRHSAPAAVKMRSSPSASAWCRTGSLPGTIRARTPSATFRPSEHLGRRAEVLDPAVGAGANEDDVDGDLGDGRARLQSHVVERAAGVVAAGERDVLGLGTWPVTSTVIAGLVPQVTCGTSAEASMVTWRSKAEGSSVQGSSSRRWRRRGPPGGRTDGRRW